MGAIGQAGIGASCRRDEERRGNPRCSMTRKEEERIYKEVVGRVSK